LLALRGAITPCVECLTRPSFHAPRIGCSAPREHGHIRHLQTRLAFLYTLLRRFELALAHAYPGHPAHTPSLCPELRVTLTFLACCCHILEQCCPTRCVCVFHAVVPSYPPCRSNPRSTHAPHTRTGCALATLTRLGDPVSRHTHTHTHTAHGHTPSSIAAIHMRIVVAVSFRPPSRLLTIGEDSSPPGHSSWVGCAIQLT
jgi:hypothetical protein